MRKAQSGTSLPQKLKSVTVPAIGIGAVADVALAADADYAGIDEVLALPAAALEANLVVAGAWVSNPATGVVTVRFHAGAVAVAGGAINFLIVALESD